MSMFRWSRSSLSEIFVAPPLEREKLRRYSWLFDIMRVKGTIVPRIAGPVLTCTLFATLVAVIHIHYKKPLNMTNNVVPLLSVVVGLILVFRNGTSYDRWYEGSKDWETMLGMGRNLSRQIWITVTVLNPKTSDSSTIVRPSRSEASSLNHRNLREDKIRVLNLIIGYFYAVKHHLRRETGLHYADMEGLFPEDFSRFDHETLTLHDHFTTPVHKSTRSAAILRAGTLPTVDVPTTAPKLKGVGTSSVYANQRTPLLNNENHTIQFHSLPDVNSQALPLIVAHEISRILHVFKKNGCLDDVGPAGANALNQLVYGLISQLGKMERVLSTPIPTSYGIHLKQCVTLYLFTLPFTLINDLKWFMIPVVTVVSFTLMGIEGIADEIEMPWGHDLHDLPLDRWCQGLKSEINYMIERLPEGTEDYEVD